MMIYGVHVHVGVPSRDAVLPLLDAMLCHYPHLQALSASSPFWAGVDTGYTGNRALMFQQLPTAGLPFQFETWPEYEAYVDDNLVTGVIDDISELRWDIRPSPQLGTLEVRVCDGVPTLLEVGALTALTHCLVVEMGERLRDGLPLPRLAPWHAQENKWRAARYLTDAIVIVDRGSGGRAGGRAGDRSPSAWSPRSSPTCSSDLPRWRAGWGARPSWRASRTCCGPACPRQRKVAAAAGGDLTVVVRSLVAELRAGRPVS
jgi:carboxylate-amine ligase